MGPRAAISPPVATPVRTSVRLSRSNDGFLTSPRRAPLHPSRFRCPTLGRRARPSARARARPTVLRLDRHVSAGERAELRAGTARSALDPSCGAVCSRGSPLRLPVRRQAPADC